MSLQPIFDYIDQHAGEYIDRLQILCRQPSIAAQNVGMEETGLLVAAMLRDIGAPTQMLPASRSSAGRPIIYGPVAGKARQTLSFYNHYDVQPPEPLELWHSAPFGCEVREGRMYARGVADNKGDLVARICAVDAWRKVRGDLPVTIKFIVEGEEEIGSPHLGEFAAAHADLLAADGNLWEGSGLDPKGRLEIWLGVKGMAYVELRAHGANTDMHSMWASVVANPAWRLLWAIATLKGPDERVRIPGFYDRVQSPTPTEHEALATMDFDEAGWAQRFSLKEYLLGLKGTALLEKHIFQPTCNIAGLVSGYTGPGVKTVLPNLASAKIDMRLVPDQRPDEVVAGLRKHLAEQGFGDIEVEVLSTEYPAKTPLDAPLARICIVAARELYPGEPVIYPMVPGTGPMYVLCQKFGIPSVSIGGVADAASNYHAPNESVALNDFIRGIKLTIAIIERFGAS
jgi:acetylornithine deacetylase/succinyl-diaminopimelate desuccinylase-like protein